MAKVWFSRWPPVGHKIGQIAKIKKISGCIRTPSFIEIAPAVTKRALLTDDNDDDGRQVIATKNSHIIRCHCRRFPPGYQLKFLSQGDFYVYSTDFTLSSDCNWSQSRLGLVVKIGLASQKPEENIFWKQIV
jgi:hypothetical protein